MATLRQIRSHAALRGVAALLVVAYHLQFSADRLPIERATPFFARCYLFVDLFFVLSGFIISYVNDAERTTPFTRGELASFARSRIARLYPLHLFCLACFALFVAGEVLRYALAGRPYAWLFDFYPPGRFVAQLLLVNAWLPGADGWNVPTWSISAEVAAYLLFPALVMLRARAPRLVPALLLAAALAFYGAVTAAGGSLDITVGLGPARCLAGFGLGMLLFYARRRIAALPTAALSATQLLAVAAIVVLLATPSPDPLVMPAFVLLVGATWPDRGVVARALARRPLLWLGDISYSVYLTHVCIGTMLGFFWDRLHLAERFDPALVRLAWIGLAFGATLLVSHLTFNRVERPARQWLARRWTGHRAPPIATAPAAP